MDAQTLCPLITPFRDGRVDRESLRSVIDHVLAGGVDGLVPCGTTGEFAALRDAERQAVIETTVQSAAADVPVIAGVGDTVAGRVREHVEAAVAAGVDAVMVPPPYYGGQASADGNEAWFEEAVGDADCPVYLYNIPGAAGQELSPDLIATLADVGLADGIKDTTGDVTHLDQIIARTPDEFTVLQGWDAAFVPALVMGADGGVNAGSHIVPGAFRATTTAVAGGDLETARRHQANDIDPVFHRCLEDGFASTVKAALADRGIIASAAVRPPLTPVPESDRPVLSE